MTSDSFPSSSTSSSSPPVLVPSSSSVPVDPAPINPHHKRKVYDDPPRPGSTTSTLSSGLLVDAEAPSSDNFSSPAHPTSAAVVPELATREDIEMEPIAGHRRRKSSLMNPVGGINAPSTRTLVPSARHPSPSIAEQPAESSGPAAGANVSTSSYDRAESSRDSFSDQDLHDDEETGLTTKERAHKQKRKRRNTRLDQRIAREKHLSAVDKREADKDVVKKLLINIGFILLWYLFSLSISLVS